jgi:hypothetical protein
MKFSRPAIIVALVLAGCGSSSGTTADAGTSTTTDSGTPEGEATGSCKATGAETGTVDVFATCGNANPSGPAEYVFALVSVPFGASPGVGGTFPFGASAPTLGKSYGLSDAATGSAPVISFKNESGKNWMAGDLLSFQPNNGSISLKLTSCDSEQGHGTLTSTLKPVSGTGGDVTLNCTF